MNTSEFVCVVCGLMFHRNTDEELEQGNFAFNTDINNTPTTSYFGSPAPSGGLVWTCSDRCKLTYTLQRV